VKVGDQFTAGEEIAILEAMKMQNILRAARDATVKAIPGSPGKSVSLDEIIVEFISLK
jgi:propionyl-CoA carboxylase alpha chain